MRGEGCSDRGASLAENERWLARGDSRGVPRRYSLRP
jgi:hypothetical protein